jgi:hypothetical protein
MHNRRSRGGLGLLRRDRRGANIVQHPHERVDLI